MFQSDRVIEFMVLDGHLFLVALMSEQGHSSLVGKLLPKFMVHGMKYMVLHLEFRVKSNYM